MYFNLQLSLFLDFIKTALWNKKNNTSEYKIRRNSANNINTQYTSISRYFATDCPILSK